MASTLRGTTERLLKKYWPLLYVVAILMVACYYAVRRIYDVEFVATNGDFQTYNVLRRLLDGQVPYRDFANYLGMGVLWMNAPLLLFSNSFIGSLFVTHFVAKVAFILLAFTVLYLVSGNKPVSAFVSLLLPRLVENGLFSALPAIGPYVQRMLEMMASPQNSMRIVRSFLPVLLLGLCEFLLHLYRRRHGGPADAYTYVGKPVFCLLLGLLLGFSMLWSNDFGFACIGAALLMLLVLLIHRWRIRLLPVLGRLGAFASGCAGGVLAAAFLYTGGHPAAYFRYTAGIGSYQYWYFLYDTADRQHSVLELVRQPALMVQTAIFVAVVVWALHRLVQGRLSTRNLLFVFLFTSFVLATYMYVYGSGGYNMDEPLATFVVLAALGLVQWLAIKGAGALYERLHRPLLARAVALGIAGLYFLYLSYSLAGQSIDFTRHDFKAMDNYVEELGGPVGYADELWDMQQLVGDTPFFSTYATALDLMQGQFQPSGTDYIIHALGDRQREEYIRAFTMGEYKFVQTLNPFTVPWEPWLLNVSWDFYALLYRDYEPVYIGRVWALWQRLPEGEQTLLEASPTVQLSRVSGQAVRLEVTTDVEGTCLVELVISYDSGMALNAYRLQTWNYSLYWQDENILYTDNDIHARFLPHTATGLRIPVIVRDGVGNVSIEALPGQCAWLEISAVECTGRVYPVL